MNQSQAHTKSDTLIELLELSRNEVELIHQIRTRFRFGEITIKVHNGQPMGLRRIMEVSDLSTPT